MTDIFDAAYKAYDDNQPHSQGILAVVNVVLGIEQERFDAAWLKWRAEKDQLKHYHELLNRENEQFREALGIARTEYGGKNIEDLDEYDRLRLTANAFQAMNGVLDLQVRRLSGISKMLRGMARRSVMYRAFRQEAIRLGRVAHATANARAEAAQARVVELEAQVKALEPALRELMDQVNMGDEATDLAWKQHNARHALMFFDGDPRA